MSGNAPITDDIYNCTTCHRRNLPEKSYPHAALEQQLLAALQNGPKGELEEIVHNIRAEVRRHANGAPQSDDVTMVAIKYLGTVA
jgi:serine phosphatase RsbU (regulator of sigma subunit)